MNALRYLWFALSIPFYPVRLLLFYIHRTLVFSSKSGAKLIVPIVLLAAALVMRTKIDALAGAFITDQFWEFRETDLHDLFAYRMEITFTIGFFSLYLALAILARITTPIVGAIPAPRAPLMPRPPLVARKHVIKTQKASVVVSGKGSRYKGDLAQLQRFMPAHALAVLEAGRSKPHEQARPPQSVQEAQLERDQQQAGQLAGELPHAATIQSSTHEDRPRREEQKRPDSDPANRADPPEVISEPDHLAARHEQQREGLEPTSAPQGREADVRQKTEPREARPPDAVQTPLRRVKPARPPKAKRPERSQPEEEDAKPLRRSGRRVPKNQKANDEQSPERDEPVR